MRPRLLPYLLPILLLAACAIGRSEAPEDTEVPAHLERDGAPTPEALALLALVNDPGVDAEELDLGARLDRRAAYGIVGHRDGADGLPATDDDDLFDDVEEIDAVKYVGPYVLDQLLAYAIEQGYLDQVRSEQLQVVFSPQPYADSHNPRVAALIDEAQESLDIAMYSFSDGTIFDALERAVQRGVSVRFLFETASDDRKLTGGALQSSRSGRLEAIGVDVRWVNKILHHKYVIVDGPRHDLAAADAAAIATGSGNWSWGAATRYDENTLFLRGERELTLRLQREFDHLWEHSRELAADPGLPTEHASLLLDEATLAAADVEDVHAYFTSANFDVTDTTFRVTGRSTVSEALVAAILDADISIWVASGHLRSRPIAEALLAAHAANPELDVRVYLDGQEHISAGYHAYQLDRLDDCLAEATTETQRRRCTDRGFYFGYQLGDEGIPVRYKTYSYRWHVFYAEQMHHKYLIIDGDELWTGSYNLSDNAEHNTFENMLVLRGPRHAALVGAYQQNFARIWQTGRDGRLDALVAEIETADEIPLVFPPMALDWAEVTALEALLREHCDVIDSDAYRSSPENHHTCPR